VGPINVRRRHPLTQSFVTMLAAEIGVAFVLASALALWAKRGFRLPKRSSRA